MSKILLISDNIATFPELCACGLACGKEITAFVVGSADDAKKVVSYGAKKVFNAPADENKMFEDYYATIKATVDSEKPAIIVVSATSRGRLLAGKLAASLGTSVITDASNISADATSVTASQMYYGGVAIKTVKSKGTAVLTLPAGAYDAVAANPANSGEVVAVNVLPSDTKIVRKECRKKATESVNLGAAKKVVGVGRGIAKKEDLNMINDLAAALGAEVGCSRPIAEGEGWLATERYIGVSGVMLKPDVYFAIGISGQVQHTIGINASKVIVAINKDKNAPIFKGCDYGIVGDLYKVVPELIKLIKSN